MSGPLLIATDLDRTVIPNGPQEESPGARRLFRTLASRPETRLAYVSGRRRALVEDAIRTWELPLPDYIIADVGTTIYASRGETHAELREWHEEIAADWAGRDAESVHELLTPLLEAIPSVRLQEPETQGRFKLSYYAASDIHHESLVTNIVEILAERGLSASPIWSVDDVTHTGYLDVLPQRATKLHGIRFVMRREAMGDERIVAAGDSGNDLPVLTSGIPAVLVRNASDEVRRTCERLLAPSRGDRLYFARGGFLGMNGNYSAGVLEGVAHFHEEVREWLA